MEAGHRDRPRPDTDEREDGSAAERLARLRELRGLGEPHDDELGLPADDGPEGEPDPEAHAELDTMPEDESSFRELRPQLKLRTWQIAPIVALGALGSLMFAFPLAFEFGGDGGPVVAMLGLLLSCCSAGWAIMAARRVGYTWPGLPVRGSGCRPDWRVVVAYVAFAALIGVLAVVRVARLR